MERNQTHWIWLESWSEEEQKMPGMVLFRKKISLAHIPVSAGIRISADSRYKLYVNGSFAEAGPCKGNREVWYRDEIDLLPFIRQGENVLAVEVLRYPVDVMKGNYGICRTASPGLYIEGTITDAEGKVIPLDGDSSWKVRKNTGYQIIPESDSFAPLQIYEKVRGDWDLKGWKYAWYDDGSWMDAAEYPDAKLDACLKDLQPRPIPFLYRKPKKFEDVVVLRRTRKTSEQWRKLLWKEEELTIDAHSREIIELTAGEEMTGYLRMGLIGGAGSHIRLLQSEAYVTQERKGNLPVKRNRLDWETGHLEGYCDCYEVSGFGEEGILEEYEPFWFRTFRFIRLEIETGKEPLSIRHFDYVETGYPLQVMTAIAASSPKLEKIWEISERTLRRCMHETYEDCPFYEQLQYAMDSRSQILYTYSISGDDRLARKCMEDFRHSQREDGLLNSFYPAMVPHVIPGFSIYYVGMLYDHMMYFGDRKLLERHFPAADRLLQFFHQNRTKEGYIGKIGGLNGKGGYWSFIDWTKEWDATTGVPPATQKGPITMESLLYVLGLQYAVKIADYLGYEKAAKEYEERALMVQRAVNRYCTGENGMLQDGPGVDEYSQHVQVFAALTETVDAEKARENLLETVLHRENYAQCSVAMAFYLFRALEKTGLYAYTKEYWDIWDRMVENNASTCVEDDVGERSECHAWGALILYELPAVILGVHPGAPGYGSVEIHPRRDILDAAKGNVATPYGCVSVAWDKESDFKIGLEPEIKR